MQKEKKTEQRANGLNEAALKRLEWNASKCTRQYVSKIWEWILNHQKLIE